MDRQREAEVLSLASDEERFAEIHERWCPESQAYVARRTSADRVDDAVADTYLVAWRRIDERPSDREGLPRPVGPCRRAADVWVMGQRRRAARRGVAGDRAW